MFRSLLLRSTLEVRLVHAHHLFGNMVGFPFIFIA
jgi:hypothetical protein